MRSLLKLLLLPLLAWAAYAQSANGTITGTITDPAGAVVAGAMVQARNVETGALYPTASTTAGNYTIAQLPVGTYEVSVTVPGFKKFVRSGITVAAAQTLRVDVSLEVGAATESVTVQADASMLKTEDASVSTNVTVQNLDQLPMLGTGAAQSGSSGIRNPNNVMELLPGTMYVPNSQVKVNGAPSNSQAYYVEGMDATNQLIPYAAAETQPSVDAIQEVAVQTSNFAPEFGAVGGGYMNVTMRSGTNQLHGSAYDYFVNEVLNAGTPFTVDPNAPDEHLRPAARRNDYGFTLGGPVFIPKVYNGKDKTFFFFNFEQFRETDNINNIPDTVPSPAYRSGDFSQAIAAANNTVLGTDPLGRPLLANEIFDPNTAHLVNGQLVTDPFPNNIIPGNRLDPIALKVQNNIPLPNLAGLLNNYQPSYPSTRHTTIPAFKIDQILGAKAKLSFYYSFTHTDSLYSPIYGNSDGLPDIISQARGTFIHSHIERLNYDDTLTPTLLLHVGAGYQENDFFDDAPILNFNAAQTYGLTGATLNRNTPVFTGFCGTVGHGTCSGAGGMNNIGPPGQGHTFLEKPSADVSTTWVKGNHTLKAGAEVFFIGIPTYPYTSTNGAYTFSPNETAEPYLIGTSGQQNLRGGTVGFGYASFLLGAVDSYNIAAASALRNSKRQWGLFLQDDWKLARNLTLTYGVRWDYGTYVSEEHGRTADFSPTTPNPNAGGLPGAWIYEATCHCNFAQNYPYAIGPRLGLAWQITPKTVLRAGWGLIYNQTGTTNTGFAAAGSLATNTVSSPSPGVPAMYLASGIPPNTIPTWPNFTPGAVPAQPGTVALSLPGGLGMLDNNAGRPARQNQWSIGIQREITNNLVVEASYVGNRGVWWNSTGMLNINGITPGLLAAHGLNLASTADQNLLLSPLDSPSAIARGFTAPYAGFPLTDTVAQSLRPFPQFGFIPVIGAPLGKTWYDSLQAKVTKRLSHGLFAQAAFTWQKSEAQGLVPSFGSGDGNPNTTVNGSTNYVYNNVISNYANAKSIDGLDQPFLFVVSASYLVPTLHTEKVASWLLRDWQVGALLQYGSGLPIPTPAATTSLANQIFQPTLADRVPGQPLYTVPSINCHCFDPSSTFVLNPKAWANPPAGQFGTAAEYYSDFRYQRHPMENANINRNFKITERLNLNLRLEMDNIFNRTYLNNPYATNPFIPQTVVPGVGTTGGWGYINRGTTSTQFGQPRSGMIIARFTF
ncbi:MAG TPA: TonB-dependent receptor [Bryobacteraceae bacterium]|nr:TonB-dependent receptor [Bryobacteraceae bacterium]